MFDSHAILIAFLLTLLAGLATGIGSIIAFFAKRTNTRFLCISLGFSAGVMLYVSFVEILAQSRDILTTHFGVIPGSWIMVGAFFGGVALIGIIDKLVPSDENPHELHLAKGIHIEHAEHGAMVCIPANFVQTPSINEPGVSDAITAMDSERLKRTGLFTALAIAIHNFPEGLATFTMALTEPAMGVAIAVAIAIHNIPEGIAVSVPIYYATGDKKKAFVYSFLSGLSEPLGALLGFLLLMPFLTPMLMGILFSGVAGIMVFISLDELLPAAEAYGEHHLCIYGLIAGMAVMAVSLLLFL